MKFKNILVALALIISINAFAQPTNQSTEIKSVEKEIKSKTIVFIHGLFINNKSWDNWKLFFEEKGYTCYTPANPGHEGVPSKLRANPPIELRKVRLNDWIENLENLIDGLPEKPILIGHSFGGLTAQKLVNSGRAEAAILISSAPPKGVLTSKFSFWKANHKSLNFFKGRTVFNPKESKYKKWFHFAFANTLTREESDVYFEKFAVPESRRTHRDAIRKIAKVDTKKAHVPLLFVAGLDDITVPNVLVRKNIKKYKDENSILDAKFFEGKDHFICGAPGWEKVATYISDWLIN